MSRLPRFSGGSFGSRNRKGNPTVLIVDSDLGFTFWLGRALDHVGYNAVPARTPLDANELIQEHRISVDILVIDPSIPGALLFISRLRQSRRSLKIVSALSAESDQPPPVIDFDAVKRKPQHPTDEVMHQWVSLVQRLAPSPAPVVS